MMESRRENRGEKRKRKIITGPVLVRSAKPGEVMSASYTKPGQVGSLWKAA